jgi:small subunit ribosomal protein S20
MANTASAERRARSSERRRLRNRSVKSRLRKLEKQYLEAVGAGRSAEAAEALRKVSSVLDKAAKAGVLHKATVSRKKSRLAVRLKSVK